MERRAAELKFAANLRGKRQRLIASFNTRVVLYYALLMPTVAKVAPPMAAACRRCRINALILRNVLSSQTAARRAESMHGSTLLP